MRAVYFDERRARMEYYVSIINDISIRTNVNIPCISTDFYNVVSHILNNTVDRIELARELCEPKNCKEVMSESDIRNFVEGFEGMMETRFNYEWYD